jgi:hypothetical protein
MENSIISWLSACILSKISFSISFSLSQILSAKRVKASDLTNFKYTRSCFPRVMLRITSLLFNEKRIKVAIITFQLKMSCQEFLKDIFTYKGMVLIKQIFFILVNKTNKYSKLTISLLGFAQIVRPEFETRVRVFFFYVFNIIKLVSYYVIWN